MLVLGLDTALGACSAALVEDGRTLARAYEAMRAGQAERLAPMVAEVAAAAGLGLDRIDRIAVTTGPGTFTGQRVGLAFARALALALKRPCIGLTTLEALAQGARIEADVTFAAIDARRGEVYAQAFGPDLAPLTGPALMAVEDAAAALDAFPGAVALAGTGAGLIAARRPDRAVRVAEADQPDAEVVARMAADRDPAGHPPAPLYLRAPDAKLPGPMKPRPAPVRRR